MVAAWRRTPPSGDLPPGERRMAISEKIIEETVFGLMKKAAIELPEDVVNALQAAAETEDNPTALGQFQAFMDNIRIAHEKQVGLCQDTGMPIIYADLGLGCRLEGDPVAAMTRGVARATREVPLRQNVINPLTLENPGTNTGWGIPYLHWDVVPGEDCLELMCVPKGFGSEMRASQVFILTSENIARGTVKAVLDVVEDAMGEACPPVIIGVGIGGFSDSSMAIAKKALFRPIGTHNPDPMVAELETEIYEAVNSLGIGPMGFGGKTYTLGVHIEMSGAHTAVAPVSVIFQCWVCRYSRARIHEGGRVEFLTHPETGGR
jgi:fumarate hydratase subunit alpha